MGSCYTMSVDKLQNMFKQDRQCTHNIILRRVRLTIVFREKGINNTYSECVYVSIATQHAKRIRRIVTCGLSGPPPPYFSTLSHKRHEFRRKSY